MVNTKLAKILHKLEKLPYTKTRNAVKQYPVEMLELLAGSLYDECRRNGKTRWELLNYILLQRWKKLNTNFEWTTERKDKFVKINNKITQIFEKAYNEAVFAANELENRINNNDAFITDYEIEIVLSLYFGEEQYEDNINNSFAYVLSEPRSDFDLISFSFGYNDRQITLQEMPLYLDTSENWNREYLGDIFKDDYIGYAIHTLLEHHWSFIDILNIKRIWADVKIRHQYFAEQSFCHYLLPLILLYSRTPYF